jgi:Flp pilus assembly protein CpaB
VDTAVGQRALVPVAAGEQITPAKVGAPTEGAGTAYGLSPGKVAVGVEVTEATQAGGNLLPGDHVDLLATFSLRIGAPVAAYTV